MPVVRVIRRFTIRSSARRPRLRGLVARVALDRGGSMLPAVAIGAGLFLASASLAIDAGRAFVEQNHLQTTADAAALAATRRIVDTQAALAAALKVARANMPLERYGRVLDESDVEFGRWDSAAGTFEVGSEDRNAVRVTTRRAAASGNALFMICELSTTKCSPA